MANNLGRRDFLKQVTAVGAAAPTVRLKPDTTEAPEVSATAGAVRAPTAAVCLLIGISVLVARAADAEKGKAVFERCAACHQLAADKNDDAPTLAGIFGRKSASIPEFRYSAAMKRSMVVWDEDTLDTFIKDPQAFVPGNRMPFDGIADKTDREDLFAYLKQATASSAR